MRRFLNGIILLLLGLSVAAAVCMVLLVFFLVGERKDAELTPVLSIPMN